MTFDELKPNKILRGPLFAEPVEVIVTVPMGAAVKLYVDFHCAAPEPSLNILHDPSPLDWQAVTKIEQYRLRQDSIAHPVALKEEPPYSTGGAA